MYRPGTYIGKFADAHLHLLGDCVQQFLTASLFIQTFQVDRMDDGMFRLQIELVGKSRNNIYSLLLGDLRERFEQILRRCQPFEQEQR